MGKKIYFFGIFYIKICHFKKFQFGIGKVGYIRERVTKICVIDDPLCVKHSILGAYGLLIYQKALNYGTISCRL